VDFEQDLGSSEIVSRVGTELRVVADEKFWARGHVRAVGDQGSEYSDARWNGGGDVDCGQGIDLSSAGGETVVTSGACSLFL